MELERKILDMLIDRLGLEDIDPETVDYDMNLFAVEGNEGFGLDSVDALEIVVGIKSEFNVSITKEDDDKFILKNINSIAKYIRENQEK